MYQGTTIDELIDIVTRAEEHARELQMHEFEALADEVSPRFVYDMPASSSVLVGVA